MKDITIWGLILALGMSLGYIVGGVGGMGIFALVYMVGTMAVIGLINLVA